MFFPSLLSLPCRSPDDGVGLEGDGTLCFPLAADGAVTGGSAVVGEFTEGDAADFCNDELGGDECGEDCVLLCEGSGTGCWWLALLLLLLLDGDGMALGNTDNGGEDPRW